LLLGLRELLYYFHRAALAAAGLALAAGFALAATAVTPSTDSFSALAGVKRSRVRAGILICSPVAGFRPTRAASLRLRKTPRLAEMSPYTDPLVDEFHLRRSDQISPSGRR
jgi:hypothetical protein